MQVVEGKKTFVSASFPGCTSDDQKSSEDESSEVIKGGFITGNFVIGDAPGATSDVPEGTLIFACGVDHALNL